MQSCEWLKIEEGKTSGNFLKSRNSPILSVLFHNKRMQNMDDCEFDGCKMRVGPQLVPMLEILMDNLP